MSKLPETVPLAAQNLLDFIQGKEAPEGFDTIFGNRQGKLRTPITKMTLGDLIDAQKNWGNKTWVKQNWGYSTSSSASGAYQFMRDTLIGICKEVPTLRGDVLFSESLQKRLGYYLLLRRGYQDYVDGRLSIVAFGLNLAKEWASFPVLSATHGQHRDVKRGQSYYAGDGLNKALVSPEAVEARLRHVRDIHKIGSDMDLPPKAADDGGGITAAPMPAPIAPENVDPENLDKPLAKSKTVWQWIITTLIAPAIALITNPYVQALLIVVVAGFAFYAIKRRADIAKVYRVLKEEIGA
ncbi:hypothetical protein [Agrobacterium sp. 22117]|uniref:hypothetical protein n=1 Tax=Agrobacterium sp. 22117 TaxID=3453880 RepID=UPI003F842C98